MSDTVNHGLAKLMSVFLMVGITSWQEAAGVAGFIYSCILIGEWLIKKFKKRERKA